MRVSNALVVLAWLCSWGQAQESKSSKISSRVLPEKFLVWPFSPGEDWRITNSYPHGSGIPYALDLQRVGTSLSSARELTQQSAVRAAAAGTVIAAVSTDGGGYGKYVVVDHGKGFATLYGHLREVAVKPGAKIPALEKLGIAGSTGKSTGAHIHFEVRDMQGVQRWQDGKFVKPEPILGRRDFAEAAGNRVVSYTLNDMDPSLRATIEDVSNKLSEAFGGKPEKPPKVARRIDLNPEPERSRPTPAREPPKDPDPERGATDETKGAVKTMGPFRFVTPAGWGIAERHSDGLGLTLGPAGVKGWPRYITFLRRPGLAAGANTPEGVNRAIQRITQRRGTTAVVEVGKDKYPGLWFSGQGGGYVLFSHGGHVYMLGYGSSADTGALQEILQNIEPKR